MKLTLGADPEVFWRNNQNELISAVGKIGGYKQMPRDLGEGYAILEDNVAAEFNIPPARSFIQFNHNIHQGIIHVDSFAKKHGLSLSRVASGRFSDEELQTPEAQEFGCDPDFNAWQGGAINDSPSAADSNFRSCGGHIHVGYDVNKADRLQVIRSMDLFLGVPSVILDTDKERKVLYGKAGAYRPKMYGVEYRVLSNFWIFKPMWRYWVWLSTKLAVQFASEYNLSADSAVGKLIQHTINEADEDGYRALCEEFPVINLDKLTKVTTRVPVQDTSK